MTPEELNAAVNDPDVLPFVAEGYIRVDMAPFLANPENIALRRGPGVMIFAHMGNGFYDGHLLFPRSVRGLDALISARSMISEVFTQYAARAISGEISRDNRAARTFTRALGFTNTGSQVDPDGRETVSYRMTRDQWERLSADW